MKAYMQRTATTARSVSALVVTLGIAFGAGPIHSAPLMWQDNSTGDLLSANWYNDTTNTLNNAPAAGDNLNLGAGGTATFSGTFAPNIFRIGHPFNPDGQPLAGPGTFNQSGGDLTVAAFLHIGEGNAGEFNLTDGTVTNNNNFFQVGWNNTGTLNQSGGSITTNWMSLGTVPTGNGTVNMTAGSIDVGVGLRVGAEGTGLFDMSTGNGMVTAGFIAVSDFPVSTGEMRVGDQSQIILDNNDRFILGWGRNATTGAQSNGKLTMTGGSITLQTKAQPAGPVADMVVGWGGVGQLDLSGGMIDVGNTFITALDGASGAAARSQATINHSGGTLNAVRMILSDRGETNYNLSGTGQVNLVEDLSLGRFLPASGVPSIATVTQTGGAMNVHRNMFIANGLDGGTGVYDISGGALDVDSDLVVGFFDGDARLGVIGADSQITVGNNYFQDPNGELFVQIDSLGQLTTIDVTGDALFRAGTQLIANFDNYPAYGPGQFWNVLTAANITDNGIALTAPAGVLYQIIGGGNGQILQLYVPIPEPASMMLAAVAGLALFVPRRRALR